MSAPNIVTTDLTIGTLIASGVGRQLVPFYVELSKIVNSTDLITAFPLTFKGRVIAMDFVTQTKVTTGSKAATLTPKLKSGSTTTAVTGGVVALTSALCTPEGAVIAGSAVTAANSFASGDSLTISATSVTAFVEGTGWLLLTVINDDTLGAVARSMAMFT